MLGGATDIQQQYDEYSLAQQFVFQQLITFCNEFKEAQLLKEKNLHLKAIELKQKQQEKMMFWGQIQYFICSLSTVSLIILLGLSIGIFVGINIPDGAGCSRENLLCDKFRLRQPKVEITMNLPVLNLSTLQ
ncbi:MAG: hypothetical protein WBM44_00610 [Waterburya sp.]